MVARGLGHSLPRNRPLPHVAPSQVGAPFSFLVLFPSLLSRPHLPSFPSFPCCYRCRKAETGLYALNPDGDIVITREKSALVAGLGYGFMSAIMQFTSVLDAATGPGTLPARGCSSISLFVISGEHYPKKKKKRKRKRKKNDDQPFFFCDTGLILGL